MDYNNNQYIAINSWRPYSDYYYSMKGNERVAVGAPAGENALLINPTVSALESMYINTGMGDFEKYHSRECKLFLCNNKHFVKSNLENLGNFYNYGNAKKFGSYHYPEEDSDSFDENYDRDISGSSGSVDIREIPENFAGDNNKFSVYSDYYHQNVPYTLQSFYRSRMSDNLRNMKYKSNSDIGETKFVLSRDYFSRNKYHTVTGKIYNSNHININREEVVGNNFPNYVSSNVGNYFKGINQHNNKIHNTALKNVIISKVRNIMWTGLDGIDHHNIHSRHGYFGTSCNEISNFRLDGYEIMRKPFTPSVDIISHSVYADNPWTQYESGIHCTVYPSDLEFGTNSHTLTHPSTADSLKYMSISKQTLNNVLEGIFENGDVHGKEQDYRNENDFKDVRVAKILLEPVKYGQFGEVQRTFPINRDIMLDLIPTEMDTAFTTPTWQYAETSKITNQITQKSFNNLSMPSEYSGHFNMAPGSDRFNIPFLGETPRASLDSQDISPSLSLRSTSLGVFPRPEQSIFTLKKRLNTKSFQSPFSIDFYKGRGFQFLLLPIDETLAQYPYSSQYGKLNFRVLMAGGYLQAIPSFSSNNYADHSRAPSINRYFLDPYGYRTVLPPWKNSDNYGFVNSPRFQLDIFGNNPFLGKVPWLSEMGLVISRNHRGMSFPSYGFFPKNYFNDASLFKSAIPSNWLCAGGCVAWDQGIPRPVSSFAWLPILRSGTSETASGPTSNTFKPSLSSPGPVTGNEGSRHHIKPEFPNSELTS